MNQHTPGPWHANCAADDRFNETCVSVREPARGDIVATVNGGANARLIAAAPKLLYACEMMVEAARVNGQTIGFASEVFDLANAAIREAKGES